MSTTAQAYRDCLPDLADQLAAQLLSLRDNPTPDRCDWMVRTLYAAQTAVRRLRTELQRRQPPTV
jgi:hypothetical protein